MKKLLLLPLIVSMAACSTLTSEGTAQTLMIDTINVVNNDRITDARCDLKNDEGNWSVVTPGSVMVHRSNKALQVQCVKEKFVQDNLNVDSDTKSNMWGNIIFGGGIGAIIDHNNGSAYDYPPVIKVPMRPIDSIVKNQEVEAKVD